MTFENRVKRYKAFKDLGEGRVLRPFGYPNWEERMSEAKKSAEDLLAKYPDVEVKEVVEETKPKGKK